MKNQKLEKRFNGSEDYQVRRHIEKNKCVMVGKFYEDGTAIVATFSGDIFNPKVLLEEVSGAREIEALWNKLEEPVIPGEEYSFLWE